MKTATFFGFILIGLILTAYIINSFAAATTTTAQGTTATTSGGAYSGDFVKASCECTCGKDKDGNARKIGATGLYKAGSVAKLTQDEVAVAKTRCQDQCARTCGGFTDCPKDNKCTDCCDDYCTNDYKAGDGAGTGEGDPVEKCKASCKSTCEFRGTVNGITDIIYTVAAIAGAIMLAIHGIRLVTSGDAGTRDAAKASMAYVIMALVIIALAGAAVRMFTNMGQNIEPAPPDTGSIHDTECTKICSGNLPIDTCTENCYKAGCFFKGGYCMGCPSDIKCEDYDLTPYCEQNPCSASGTCKKDILHGKCISG